ncbi:MAG: asparaginase [Gemmatimonadaceae bacterium]
MFTGGTISMRVDASAGGAVPALGAAEIVAAARGIEHIADLRVEEWGRFPGPHMSLERMWALRCRLAELVADPTVDGVVVTHGTDTLEESAYLMTRSIATDKPIVFTGATRSASELGWDGPSNLTDAVRVAASERSRDFGALVVLNSLVYAGLDVTKAHTHLLDAFESPGLGPVGVVDEGNVIFRRTLPFRPPVIIPESLGAPIDIVLYVRRRRPAAGGRERPVGAGHRRGGAGAWERATERRGRRSRRGRRGHSRGRVVAGMVRSGGRHLRIRGWRASSGDPWCASDRRPSAATSAH